MQYTYDILLHCTLEIYLVLLDLILIKGKKKKDATLPPGHPLQALYLSNSHKLPYLLNIASEQPI